jgi:nitrous oxide reductase accessory protein NosL
MKRWLIGTVALSALLAGCGSDKNDFLQAPKALDKMSPEELCTFYKHYRENPDLSAHARDVATAQMRAKGCGT